ncbi:MAG: hypothetical protein K6G20_06985 [Ruminococcus sp.]|nr:hypothetical protein [Ruminococcus sp.]
MKKLIALLACCSMLTFAFASCGDKDDDDDSSKKSKTSSSAVADDEDEDEDEDESDDEEKDAKDTKDKDKDSDDEDEDNDKDSDDEDDEEKEKETKSSDDEKDSDDEDDDDDSSLSSSDVEEQLLGTWETTVSGNIIERFVFKEDGKFTLLVDWSQYFSVKGDKVYISSTDVTSFTEFDGKKFNISNNGSDVMLMTKKSGSADSYDGEYTINGGVLKDTIDKQYPNQDMTIIVDGERSYIAMNDVTTYTIEDGILKMKNTPDKLFGNYDDLASKFELKGDKLTLTDPDGTVTNLTKVK